MMPSTPKELLTCPNCKSGFRANRSIRTRAGQVVCSTQCAETLNNNNDLPLETYQPKGSICMSCSKAESKECHQLPFNEYRVIQKDNVNKIHYVRCEQYQPATKQKP
ncbi:hypothetical protein [uncultured Endozoicomonas sp.]|uniref:hypothetical protein n=1 Tax=uncultured Endozoicomonas sp. TaxID=432652 RepID=UPI0026323D25|nr:hypothetical protein [uncultured Endozoicomonas sp.]